MSALLHLVGFGPNRHDRLHELARACSPGDTLVLLDDGLAFAEANRLAGLVARLPECSIRVLGKTQGPLPAPAEAIEPAGLVELTETHRGPASWY